MKKITDISELRVLREFEDDHLPCAEITFKDQDGEQYNQILRNVPLYRKAIDSGMPFPKTRRIVFQENKPASLPGWVFLELL